MNHQNFLTGKPRRLSELELHPLLLSFSRITEDKLRESVEELRTKGQPYDLDVVDNKIVYGCRLFRAAQELKIKKLTVISHDDWADLEESVQGLHIIHRHIDKASPDQFENARLYECWRDWKSKLRRRRMRPSSRRILNDDIDKMIKEVFGRDKRTLERYLQISKLPNPIRDAVQSQQIPITRCPAILDLPREDQHRIVELIRARVPANEAVDRIVLKKKSGPKNVSTACRQLIRAVTLCLPCIEYRESKSVNLSDEDVAVLRRIRLAVNGLIRHRKPFEPIQEADIADLKKLFDETRHGCGNHTTAQSPGPSRSDATDMPVGEKPGGA